MNIPAVEGGSEEDVHNHDCLLLLAVNGTGKTNSLPRRNGINVSGTHKKCNMHTDKAATSHL